METNREWRQWGDLDPLFGVASWAGRERSGANPWTDAEFYRLGDDWLDFERRWRGYGVEFGSVLEIGCGAGRMSNRLADSFRKVVATDVAEGMLNYARPRVQKSNIEWRLSDGDRLPAEDATIDAVFSCHVFQHMTNNAAQLAVFREVSRVLRPGGTFLVHLPIHTPPGTGRFTRLWTRMGTAVSAAIGNVRRLQSSVMALFGGKPPMNMVWYDMGSLTSSLQDLGFTDVEFSWIRVRTNGFVHSCVLGRKTLTQGVLRDQLSQTNS